MNLPKAKAYKLLENMEELNHFRVLKKKPIGITSLREKIKTRMNEEEIEIQLDSIRKEWRRDT